MKQFRCELVQSIVVTIDGPAGAGKSTVARRLAALLNFDFLDTGAMYRCITLAAQRTGTPLRDETAISQLAQQITIQLDGCRVFMNGEDVSDAIRAPQVSAAIGAIADNQAVRSLLTSKQRQCAVEKCMVTEGRDQGTIVFPDSPCKIFLSASSEERAQRRVAELANKQVDASYEQILAQQNERDAEDARRPVGALKKADDAIEVCTDGMTLDEVVEHLHQIVLERLEGFELPSQSAPNTVVKPK